jgi:hypothetical protein
MRVMSQQMFKSRAIENTENLLLGGTPNMHSRAFIAPEDASLEPGPWNHQLSIETDATE